MPESINENKNSEIKKSSEQKKEKLSQEEIEEKIMELAKNGLTAEKIGETLKKQGIHTKEYNKKISSILKEKNIYVDPNLKNFELKLKKIEEHTKKNKQDKKAIREITRISSEINKTKEYLKSRN